MSTSKILSILVNKMVTNKIVTLTPEAYNDQQGKAQTRRQSLALKDNSFTIRCIDKDSRLLLSPTNEKYIGQTFIAAPADILTTSAELYVKVWFDKANGNSYFSARLYVNGELAFIMPYQYGYSSFSYYFLSDYLKSIGNTSHFNANGSLNIRCDQYFDTFTESIKKGCTKAEMIKHGTPDNK